jgi:hypothetical protein
MERRRFIQIMGAGLLIPVVPKVFDFGSVIKPKDTVWVMGDQSLEIVGNAFMRPDDVVAEALKILQDRLTMNITKEVWHPPHRMKVRMG